MESDRGKTKKLGDAQCHVCCIGDGISSGLIHLPFLSILLYSTSPLFTQLQTYLLNCTISRSGVAYFLSTTAEEADHYVFYNCNGEHFRTKATYVGHFFHMVGPVVQLLPLLVLVLCMLKERNCSSGLSREASQAGKRRANQPKDL